MLDKTTFSICVSLKPVNSNPASVFIVVRLHRPSRQVKDTTPSGAESKIFPLYALMDGEGKLKICFINIYIMLCLCKSYNRYFRIYTGVNAVNYIK